MALKELAMFEEFEAEIKKIREEDWGKKFHEIDDLPLTTEQKKCVLEYLAMKYWQLELDLDIEDGHCKSYDPLRIEDGQAHSYVFDMEDGGRHHNFRDFKHLEEMLYKEILETLKKYGSGYFK